MDDLTRLFVNARRGDEAAFEAAVRASQAETWRVVRHLVGVDDADDVTQETYVRAWKALPRFRAESSARTWLLSIARRTAVDALRSRGRRRRLPVEAPRPVDGGTTELMDLVEALPAERREAFVLTQVAGCSYAEAAEICNTALGTIRSRVARAREELVEAVRAAESA